MKKALFLFLQVSFCTVGCLSVTSSKTLAQVTSDGTVDTRVNQNGNVAEIEGGETRGSNLFHSFQDFSLPTSNEAFFNNADSISNIFSRVTGGNISNIDGVIRANGSASLFLINPSGIIFGENARLDIGGSFYSSTASSILFEDGEFSALDNLEQPVLTVNAPIGLGFRDNPGDVVNRSNFDLTTTTIDANINPDFAGAEFTIVDSVGLKVNPNQTIALVGGNVILENGGGITASGGRVELGGISQAGEVTINENGSLSFPERITRGNVTLTEQARVNVAGGGGGFINVNARNLELSQQSELHAGIAEENVSLEAQAGDITVNATELVRLSGTIQSEPFEIELDTTTGIRNNVGLTSFRRNDGSVSSGAVGKGGNIQINTENLELIGATVIDTSVFGEGSGGDLIINSSNVVLLDQGVILSQVRGSDRENLIEQGNGDSGNVFINSESLLLTNTALILADIQQGATGNGGNLEIQVAGTFTQNENSFILTQLGVGNIGSAGDINITAGSYEIGARNFLPALQSDSSRGSQGDAGNITINVDNDFSISDNLIIAQVQGESTGNAGDINIYANNLSIDDFALISSNAASDSRGTAGSVTLNGVNNINISNGAVVDALTENEFDGGDVTINAQNLNLLSGGKIVTGSENIGNAGNINLNIRENLLINNQNPAENSPFDEPILQNIELQTGLFANTFPGSTSNGGDITVNARVIDLQNNGSILAETTSGSGGNITLIVEDRVSLRNNSLISAGSFNQADGGNINIDTDFIIAFPNQIDGNGNDIIASAVGGNGGNISISAKSLLGILEREATNNNNSNDIDASSDFGLDGTISIFTPDINPAQVTTELPNNIVVPESTPQQACEASTETAAKNALTIVGRGGVIPDPALPLSSLNLYPQTESTSTIPQPIQTSKGKIQPARGIRLTESGELILTAYRTNNSGDRIPEARHCS